MSDVPPLPRSSCIGRLFLAGIGFSIALMGFLFCGILWRTYSRAVDMERNWERGTAYVMVSEIRERRIGSDQDPLEYNWNLSYRYEWGQKQWFGDNVNLRKNAWSSSREKIEAQIATFPVGAEVPCYINPQDPQQVALKLESKAAGYTLWFPILFVLGGLILGVRAIWTKS